MLKHWFEAIAVPHVYLSLGMLLKGKQMSLIQKMLVVFAVSLLIAFVARAEPVKQGALTISDQVVRATVTGQKNAGAFLTVSNNGAEDQLLSASSPASARMEVHEMKMDGNVMQMRQIDSLVIPAKGKVNLMPGGYHLMFIDLKEPLKAGDTVDIQLKFKKAGTVNVKFPIQAFKPMAH